MIPCSWPCMYFWSGTICPMQTRHSWDAYMHTFMSKKVAAGAFLEEPAASMHTKRWQKAEGLLAIRRGMLRSAAAMRKRRSGQEDGRVACKTCFWCRCWRYAGSCSGFRAGPGGLPANIQLVGDYVRGLLAARGTSTNGNRTRSMQSSGGAVHQGALEDESPPNTVPSRVAPGTLTTSLKRTILSSYRREGPTEQLRLLQGRRKQISSGRSRPTTCFTGWALFINDLDVYNQIKKNTIWFDRFESFLQLRTSGVYDVGHIARGVYLWYHALGLHFDKMWILQWIYLHKSDIRKKFPRNGFI